MLKPKDTEIHLIHPRAVPTYWFMAHEFLDAACKHVDCEYTVEMLLDECFTGNSQLWLVWSNERNECECAVVTSVIPHCAVCLIKACGGQGRQHWLGLLDEIEQWSKAQGCHTIRLYGRKGWSRILKDYKVTRLVMDKSLV
jgi:hypothetical protein